MFNLSPHGSEETSAKILTLYHSSLFLNKTAKIPEMFD